MARFSLRYRVETHRLSAPFRISGFTFETSDVVVAELSDGEFTGRGEAAGVYYLGDDSKHIIAELDAHRSTIEDGPDREELRRLMPAGGARNAVDCALWDLQARRSGKSVRERLFADVLRPIPTAVTISLDEPAAMRAAAEAVAGAPLLKVKLDDDEPVARLLAVAEGAPEARLIVDPNEGWNLHMLLAMAGPISRLNVVTVEQPLPAALDNELEGLTYPVPICADESVHTVADLERIAQRYQMVNVKLDKAGGLTGALELAEAARTLGLKVLAGCMVSSSLSIAPALWVAAEADLVDLDGPWWLTQDRAGGCRFDQGVLYPPQSGFWGDPGPRP